MIEGGWAFVWGAYGVTLGALVVMALVIVLRLSYWSKRVRELERRP
jgi:heme exporter protein CcmD